MSHSGRVRSHREQYGHVPDLVRRVARANDDVDVGGEQGNEPEKPLGRKTTQLVVPEVGDVRLRNTEPLRDRGLTKTLFGNEFIQANCERHTKLPVFGIGKTKVPKNISAASNYHFTLFSAHTSPRSLPWPPGADRASGSDRLPPRGGPAGGFFCWRGARKKT